MADASQSSPSIEERIHLWRYVYSYLAFDQAEKTAQVVLKAEESKPLLANRPDWREVDHRVALLTAMVVMYSRPFTPCQLMAGQKKRPLCDIPIPPKYQETHSTHLELRNKVFGHADATGPLTSSGALNEVVFDCVDGAIGTCLAVAFHADAGVLDATVELCRYLNKELLRLRDAFLSKHTPSLVPGTLFVLNLEDDGRPWCRRAG